MRGTQSDGWHRIYSESVDGLARKELTVTVPRQIVGEFQAGK